MTTIKEKNHLKGRYNITSWPDRHLNFWGITKCANTSIKKSLLGENINEFDPEYSNFEVHDVSKALYIDKSTALSNGFDNFTVVRNPYTRCVSMYKDFVLKRFNQNLIGFNINREGMTFDDFLKKIIIKSKDQDDIHLRSQTSFLKFEGSVAVDNIFKIEDIHPIEKFLDIHIPMINISKGEISLQDSHKSIIYDRYEQDFINFNYEKGFE